MRAADLPVKLGLTVTYLLMVFVNYLANALPLNGRQTGEISDAYENLFAPAGLTFSIWGLIYLLLALHVLYQWGLFRGRSRDDSGLLNKIGTLFALSSLANTAWVFAWHYDQILLSTLLITTILILLAVIVLTIRRHALSGRDWWLVAVPFCVYFGWLTVATVANITVLLVSAGWDGFGISADIWAAIIIAVAAAIGTLAMVRNRDMAYGFVLIWAFIGIVVKHTSADGFANQYPLVIAVTIGCIILFVASEVFVWMKRQRTGLA
ncbi:hypothetical protein SAMN06295905_1138 [Devosia lucknowensis]|uniref:TspO and MBR related proteins n=1 Tax=Devosia lucknowensis TaxID=1096929 RepID=A0A1Y6EQW5_9HYPH|nr:lantibiotic ABC transporter permease [Devosia lucknowensis]SMQ65095.1 hypothetical protein SAMN06295905_1138 [Devosia lucknowensis]